LDLVALAAAFLGVVAACAAPGPTEPGRHPDFLSQLSGSCPYVSVVVKIKAKCDQGGLSLAKSAETSAMSRSNMAGNHLTCSSCHLDQVSYHTRSNALADWNSKMAPFFQ